MTCVLITASTRRHEIGRIGRCSCIISIFVMDTNHNITYVTFNTEDDMNIAFAIAAALSLATWGIHSFS